MLIYEYPKKLSPKEQVLKAQEKMAEKKKTNNLMLRNMILLAVVILMAIFVPLLWLKIVVCTFVFIYFLMNLVLIRMITRASDDFNYTKVYDDRIEHKQADFIKLKTATYKTFTIKYADIKKSYQTKWGNMRFVLNDGSEVEIYICDTATKLYIIDNLYEQIKYPKKEYRDLSKEEEKDKDDPDYKWKNWKDL